MEIKGTVKQINDLTTDKIEKKQLVLTIEGKYPTDVAIDFLKEKCKLLDKASIGSIATAKINIQSREYQGKWYTNINCWGLDVENDLL